MTAVLNTVDPAQISRFNALATTWWDPDGPMWPLHRLNAVRTPFVLAGIQSHLSCTPETDRALRGISILDVGCGAGLLSEAMARQGATVTGIDPAEHNIRIARQHALEAGLGIDYQQCSLDELPPGQFDVVLNMEVVEHVEQLPGFMAGCCERVAPGGIQFVATINRNLLSYLVAIIGAEYLLRWLPRGTHQWKAFVTPAELTAMLAAGGLTVRATKGVAINPMTRRYRLNDSHRVNYMLVAQRHA